MQATVRSFDPEKGSGELLRDDGSALSFGAHAFEASGLRLLRLGQRVRVELDDDGRVALVTIATLH